MSAERSATAAALRALGDEIVAGLLLQNEDRWRALSLDDRHRVESLAREVVARLLEEPVRRLEQAPAAHARTVADLFGLDQSPSESPRERGRTRVSV